MLMFTVESCYEKASEFLPQRWLDQPQMVKNPNVSHAFGKGTLLSLGSPSHD
jgi:hypothetical protein